MPVHRWNGDEALARGALAAGVGLVASYPGSPSSGTVEVLLELPAEDRPYVEWSSNEKVAMELAIGASIAGRRALAAAKSVGMNAMLDPLMTLKLTPVHGGLVILLGDDPGGYGSQNDQDTRPLANLLQMPMLEPAGPGEAYEMMRDAFALSEKLETPVIIRETRSFSQLRDDVPVAETEASTGPVRLGVAPTGSRFVPVPGNVLAKHRELVGRITRCEAWSERAAYNLGPTGKPKSILASGFVYRKLIEVIGEPTPYPVFKLGVLYPLPAKKLGRFLETCDEVLVVEENDPYVEDQLAGIAHRQGCSVRILGKRSRHLPFEGELFRWQIQRALERWDEGFRPARSFREEEEASEHPPRKSHCGGCRYGEVLDALERAAERRRQKLFLVADPGCIVTVADRLDAKYAMGSAIAVADGVSKSSSEHRAVALVGDSSFFHSSIPALCNAATNGSDLLVVVLDNQATLTSGAQPNPGVGRTATGEEAPSLSIEALARASGVDSVHRVAHEEDTGPLMAVFEEALAERRLTLVRVLTECRD